MGKLSRLRSLGGVNIGVVVVASFCNNEAPRGNCFQKGTLLLLLLLLFALLLLLLLLMLGFGSDMVDRGSCQFHHQVDWRGVTIVVLDR